jgi:EmrB/QacA subfamily drug resistance transporter
MAVAAVVVLGAVMSILDVTVVNVAIQSLSRDFDAPLATIQWVATGYTLALATVIPLTGWAADRFGTKRLYMISIALFMCGSALAGAAWSANSLIFFRILQGFGGGMIMPAGMTILTRTAGPDRVGRVMAVIGVPMLLGPILGPILGGWLVDDVSWRWIFYINVPIGIVALIASLRILPTDRPQPAHRLDLLGLLLLSPGLALLVYGLAETASEGGFGAAKVLVPMLAGALLIAAFIRHALRTEEPLIDLRLFKNRVFAVASATMTLFAVAFFGAMLLMPLYFQTVRGEAAFDAGLILAPQGLGAMLTMPIAGRLVDRTGAGRIVLSGMTLVIIGFLAFTQVQADTSYWLLEGSLVVMGMGLGATMMPTFSAAMQTLQQAAVAKASTTLNIIQQVGGSIGTATMAVLLTNALTSRLPQTGEGGLGAASSIPPEARDRVLPLLADAFSSTFTWALVLVGVAVLPALLLPRRKPAPAAGEGVAEPVLTHV